MFQRIEDMGLRGIRRPPMSVHEARANMAQAAGGFADDFDGLFLDKDVSESFDIDDDCAPVRDPYLHTPAGRAAREKYARILERAWSEHEKQTARGGHKQFTVRGVSEGQCREQTANAIERRGTDKAKRAADALRAGAMEVRGGRKRSYSPVKMKDGN